MELEYLIVLATRCQLSVLLVLSRFLQKRYELAIAALITTRQPASVCKFSEDQPVLCQCNSGWPSGPHRNDFMNVAQALLRLLHGHDSLSPTD